MSVESTDLKSGLLGKAEETSGGYMRRRRCLEKKGGRVCVSNFECSLKDIASFRRIEDVRLLGSNYTTIALRQQSKKGGGEI